MYDYLYLDREDGTVADVDFGDRLETLALSSLELLSSWHQLEEGDRVAVKIQGGFLRYQGVVTSVNKDEETCTVTSLEGDVEENIPLAWVEKVDTGRELSVKKLKKSVNAVTAALAFSHGMKWD